MPSRHVELAVGFKDGTWQQVEIEVPEDPCYVLDFGEAKHKAKEALRQMPLGPKEIAFIHTLSVDDPEGGYAEDMWP